LLSTTIIHHYFEFKEWKSFWLDARACIKTDDYYRSANLNWDQTQALIKTQSKGHQLIVTQGFIGSNSNNFTTTLGREGSDYSAAIFAYALNAESVTIWKDVPGVLNGDPRVFNNTELFIKSRIVKPLNWLFMEPLLFILKLYSRSREKKFLFM